MKHTLELLQKLACNKSILIVEDDSLIIESLERLLSHFFQSVLSAQRVDEAFAIFDQHKENDLLIITDINLGEESGVEFACKVKKQNPQQKILAISGTEKREVFVDSIRCGIDRFVLKPLEDNELFEALIALLQKIDYDNELKHQSQLLEESREYALQLLEEQDQFLKNAIHEIHTPLAVIITNIDLLRMQNIENESIDAIEAGSRIIQNSYEDMTYLMKKDRMQELKENIDLVSFITERKNYFQCIAEVNNLQISMLLGQRNLPSLFFSEPKLARLIDNTLSNAIKYSYRPSEVTITVGLSNSKIFFEVHNEGPVIQNKEKIFERFHRESKHNGGYGLGLHIVAQICQEENVEVQISSTKERGTSFRYIFHHATQLQHNSPKIQKIKTEK
ncbi:ATP-binding response regulator [Sulfurimonas microaerophilic]|uniref:ATP-binding response regulator n=1 Tax=Sulfurimonas microaerophilic TaxID=3058392 RepID=UPI0027155F9B|nr:hybrid sensor histidine kinase/response regulator [Sulfurimonas sp. hsl 1-7]